MKKYFAFVFCLIMTANLFSQEKYPVPEMTFEQKFNRTLYFEWSWISLSARLAKEDGKDLYEYGRSLGKIFAPGWGKKDDMDGLIKSWIRSYASIQRAKDSAPVVKENKDGSVSIITDDNSSHDYFPEGGPISYDEFLEYWKGIVDVIAEYKVQLQQWSTRIHCWFLLSKENKSKMPQRHKDTKIYQVSPKYNLLQ